MVFQWGRVLLGQIWEWCQRSSKGGNSTGHIGGGSGGSRGWEITLDRGSIWQFLYITSLRNPEIIMLCVTLHKEQYVLHWQHSINNVPETDRIFYTDTEGTCAGYATQGEKRRPSVLRMFIEAVSAGQTLTHSVKTVRTSSTFRLESRTFVLALVEAADFICAQKDPRWVLCFNSQRKDVVAW